MCCKGAISSHSLGRASVHKLPNKLDQARRYGITGIELFYEDLEHVAIELQGGKTPANLLASAKLVAQQCFDRDLQIINLQPFMHYEGLKDRARHAERIEEMKLWLKIAKVLGTDLIIIPSTFLPESEITSDMAVIVDDLRDVAQLASQNSPPVRIAYESLAWGTHVNTWEKGWDIVQKVDMPNFGICIDTFNLAGRVYADPASSTRKTANADKDIQETLVRMKKTIDAEKVFFVQIVDGAQLPFAIPEGNQPSRMTWSRGHRLFYGEDHLGAYLPVKAIMGTVVHELGYRGWISAELFSNDLWMEGNDVPENLARRASKSWKKLVKDLDLETAQPETRSQVTSN